MELRNILMPLGGRDSGRLEGRTMAVPADLENLGIKPESQRSGRSKRTGTERVTK